MTGSAAVTYFNTDEASPVKVQIDFLLHCDFHLRNSATMWPTRTSTSTFEISILLATAASALTAFQISNRAVPRDWLNGNSSSVLWRLGARLLWSPAASRVFSCFLKISPKSIIVAASSYVYSITLLCSITKHMDMHPMIRCCDQPQSLQSIPSDFARQQISSVHLALDEEV